MYPIQSRLIAAATFVLLAVAGAAAQAPPADPGRAAAAKDLMAAMKVEEQFHRTLGSVKGLLSQQMKAQPNGDKAMELVNKIFAPDSEHVKTYLTDASAAMEAFFSERFTEAELKDIAAFQRSPAGEKLRAVTPDMVSALGPPLGKFQEALKKVLIEELNPKPKQ